jgi:hypothetical protein
MREHLLQQHQPPAQAKAQRGRVGIHVTEEKEVGFDGRPAMRRGDGDLGSAGDESASCWDRWAVRLAGLFSSGRSKPPPLPVISVP